ncbi:MAG: translation initiation factor IF-2 [Thiotrichaceae bacterium]|nr:translation initiation factor IF-2 [Thiotrichaceae bacterium]
MSVITVKQLAQIVSTPVEVMLKQMQDADIPVSSPSDTITDEQKLKLLAYIRAGQEPIKAAPASKLSVGGKTADRKISTAPAGKVNVAVRHKNRGTRRPETIMPASSDTPVASRAEELARRGAAEREALNKARGIETEKPSEKEVVAEIAEPVVEEVKTPVEAEAKTAIVKEPEPKVESVEKLVEKIAARPASTKVEEKTVITSKPKPTPAPKKETKAPEVVKVKEVPKAVEPDPVRPKRLELNFYEIARRNKAAGANKGREEAASALKKRPSRKVIKKPVVVVKKEPVKKPTKAAPPATANANANAAKNKKKKPFQGRGGNQLHMDKGRRRKKGRGRREVRIEREDKHGFEKPTAPVVKVVEIPEMIILGDLAKALSVSATDIIKQMMSMGVMATINQSLDQDTAILVTEELGHTAVALSSTDEDEAIIASLIPEDGKYEATKRPPVVTIMGHVDHGKTSLLDYIRNSRVAAGEAGGITQHVSAYHVDTPNGIISFLDTPGHAAFSAMRERGAKATDIVIIVVAADDSVMPQTKEVIKHARAANVPIIIAINKMDKENADPERVRSDLSALEVISEEWGGDDVFVEISAKTGQGIEKLLESINLVAEMQELVAPIDGPASGLVVEASVEKGRGAVATVLVQRGTLRKGDIVLCGQEYGRIRAMIDDLGKPIKEVGPSMPVSILGLSGAPASGIEMIVVDTERKAREIASNRRHKERDTRLNKQQAAKLELLFANLSGDAVAEPLNVIIKADVHGSVEALRNTLNQLSTDEVRVNIVSSAVGGINESDVSLAQASGAVIIAFNVRADASARRTASESNIEIRYYSIIYEVVDDITEALSGMLPPELREEFVGLAEVKDVFHSNALGAVAGCLVIEGHVSKGLPIRVLRDNVVIFEGDLESLRRHKDDVKEVRMGTECGIAIKDYNDVKAGDQIECFRRTEVERRL